MRMPNGRTIETLQAPRGKVVRRPSDKSLKSEHTEIEARVLYLKEMIQLHRS